MKVRAAIAELGYEPNSLGRSMRDRHVKLIGLVVSDIENPFFTSVTRGIEDLAHQAGYGVMLCNSDEDTAKEAQYLGTLRYERVPGLIIAPTGENLSVLAKFQGPHEALVTFGRRVPGLAAAFVSTDNALGGSMAARHFLEVHGYRSLAIVGGPGAFSSASERQASFIAAAKEAGIASGTVMTALGDMRELGGYAAARELLQAPAPPRAIFVVNNLMTLGVLRALREADVSVPRDVALISFDDVPWAPYLDPPLTVVVQPTHEIGEAAADQLFRQLRGDERAKSEERLLSPRLEVRVSCGCEG